MSEVLEICGITVQATQVIGIGPVKMEIKPYDKKDALIVLSFTLIFRTHSIDVLLDESVMPKNVTFDEDQIPNPEKMKDYIIAKAKIVDMLKLRPAHEI